MLPRRSAHLGCVAGVHLSYSRRDARPRGVGMDSTLGAAGLSRHGLIRRDPRIMVAETLLSSVQFAGLKSRFNSMQAGYFNYPGPPTGAGPPPPPPRPAPPPLSMPEAYPVSSLDLPAGLHSEVFNQRKQREFIPDNKKDESYWDRRRRNNEAAKRSREKRRLTDMVLESRVCELTKENHLLRAQLSAIRDKFGIVGENLINREQVLAQVPAMDQILNLTKRHKTLPNNVMMPGSAAAQSAGFMPGPLAQSPAAGFRDKSPSAGAVLPGSQASIFFRQHSLRELPVTKEETDSVCDFSRPRSAEPEPLQRSVPTSAPPELAQSRAAVDLSGKPGPLAESPAAAPPTSPGLDSGAVWPLKLRHKTLLCERETAATGLLALNQLSQLNQQLGFKQLLKEEPQDSPTGSESSSGDERDSGLSDRSASSDGADEPSRKRARAAEPVCPEDAEVSVLMMHQQAAPPAAPDTQIRSELERLAKEVATLRSLLNTGSRESGIGSSPPPAELPRHA